MSGKCLFGTLYQSPSERVYDRYVVWCVSVYSICMTGILIPFVKWEIQVQFIKKNFICGTMTKNHFSCGIMTKKKSCGIIIFLINVWQQYSLDSRLVKMTFLKLKKN